MARKIFYFSGTGNTLSLAKDLAEELGDTDLVRITYEMEYDQSMCEVAGIAYPVYCFGLPNIVVNFIRKVQFSKECYIFGLATYGGLLTSSGLHLKKALAKKGYTLQAGFAVRQPGNATTVYNVVPQEKQDAMFTAKKERLPKIAETIRQRASVGIDTNLGLLGRVASLLSPAMMGQINNSDKSFYYDETCDGCGVCVKVCPVKNITLENKRPIWHHRCESCMACFHWCPQAAIQGGKKTASRGRYHHPGVTLAEVVKRD